MGERLVISPEVIAVIRQGRLDEKAFYAKDRVDTPFGIQGEALRVEGITSSKSHSNGDRDARKAQQF